MNSLYDVLFEQVWWSWKPETEDLYSQVYHVFNLLEATIWFLLATLVLHRYLRNLNSRTEIAYSLAFLTFGVSDVFEAWEQSSLLIWLKLCNLLVLMKLRKFVTVRWYPAAKVY